MGEKISQGSHGERGFSIIELLIAMAVLSIGMVSIVGISVYVSRSNNISNAVSVLTTATQSQVDTLRAAIWTRLQEDPRLTVGGSLTSNVADHNTTRTDTPAGNLIIRWQVRQGTTDDLRYVTIKVVQEKPTFGMADGITITTIINRG